MEFPPFSVLMAVHPQQDAGHLEEALRSLVVQTAPPSEVVIVRDGALPGLLDDILQRYAERLPIRALGWADNRGLGAALRAGLEACSCSLVARLDSDDVALEHRFLTQLRHMQQSGSDVCGSFALCVREDGSPAVVRRVPLTHDRIVDAIWACPFVHGSVMYRREAILGVGNYDPALRRRQDYDLWFRCVEAGLRLSNINEPLVIYRAAGRARSRRTQIAQAMSQGRIGAGHAKRLGLPWWKRLACYYPVLRTLAPAALRGPRRSLAAVVDPRQRG